MNQLKHHASKLTKDHNALISAVLVSPQRNCHRWVTYLSDSLTNAGITKGVCDVYLDRTIFSKIVNCNLLFCQENLVHMKDKMSPKIEYCIS